MQPGLMKSCGEFQETTVVSNKAAAHKVSAACWYLLVGIMFHLLESLTTAALPFDAKKQGEAIAYVHVSSHDT